jgi:ubiquinone/menaquinone biosynthesis C-methylase UbiE
MQRIKENFLDIVEENVSLKDLSILEVGCGDGSRSVAIAKRCKFLTAIEPDEEKIKLALNRGISNILFQLGTAETLSFENAQFDMVIFTLSLHHVPTEKMSNAIDQAVRVTKKTGYIIFLEPTLVGTFFDAEVRFDACDGDERQEKLIAYETLMHHEKLQLVKEIDDETVLQFDSVDDFKEAMCPKKDVLNLQEFLEINKYTLRAERRISIFKPK